MYAGVEQIIASNQRLIEVASRQRMPIFFTKQFYEEADDNEVYARKVPALNLLRPGSPLAEIHPAIAIEKGIVLVKRFPSAFHRTELAAQLAKLNVDTVIMTGLTTSGCVRATAMDALLHNFAGIVVREAVSDRDHRVHKANLFDIDAKLADVCSETEVLSFILAHGRRKRRL
jgi:maleamate amidohydrolase